MKVTGDTMRNKLGLYIVIIFSVFVFSHAQASDIPEEFNGLAFGSSIPSNFKLEQQLMMGFGENIPNQFYSNPNHDEKDFYGYKTSDVQYEFEDNKFIAVTFTINETNLSKLEKDMTSRFKVKPNKAKHPHGDPDTTYIYLSKRSGMHLTQINGGAITIWLFSRVFGEDNQAR
jgi:hypothetical protein